MLSVRRAILIVVAAVSVYAAGCHKETQRPPDAPERQIGGPAQPPPTEVALWLSTDSPKHALDGLRAYADAVKPGTGALIDEGRLGGMLAAEVGAGSLAGLDLGAPFHVVVVDGDKVQGVVLVARIQKRTALDAALGKAHLEVAVSKAGDRWAMIGAKDAVLLVAPWVSSTLLAAPAPAPITVTVQVATVAARHKAEIDAARNAFLTQVKQQSAASGAANMEEMMGWYMDGLSQVMTDSELAVVALDASAADATLSMALVPRDGTPMAAFAAAQKPSDFALLARLPAGPAPILFAGHLEMGPFRDGWLAALGKLVGLGDLGDEYVATMSEIMRLATGDVAARMSFGEGGMALDQVFPVTDVDAARKVARTWLTSIAGGRAAGTMGIHMTLTGHADAGEHDGVPLSAYQMQVDLKDLPPAQQAPLAKMYGDGGMHVYMAFADGMGLFSMGKDEHKIDGVIDAMRGKAPAWTAAPELAAWLEQARQRHDSFVMTIDIAGMMAAIVPGSSAAAPATDGGLRVGFGFDGGQLRMSLSLSAATMRSLAPAPTSR